MVKIGFLVEGDTEKKIIRSQMFNEFLASNNLEAIPTLFPAKGNMGKDVFKNSQKLNSLIDILKEKGAKHIFVIRDLEDLECIVLARNEINSDSVQKIIVEKTMESWFLADSEALQKVFSSEKVSIEFPEKVENPFKHLKQISLEKNNRGIGDKLIFAARMLNNGFSIENAANHPNCDSAKYFIKKLKSLSNQ
ncbi:MAG: DUF4276 family protein [Leadbetterella sp.]|nr:DUF4276 family protein [Leadbetterella sp.]